MSFYAAAHAADMPATVIGGRFAERWTPLFIRPNGLIGVNDRISRLGLTRRFFRVIDGCVALVHALADGRRQIVDVFGPGRMFSLATDPNADFEALSLTFSRIERAPESFATDQMREELSASVDRLQALAVTLGRRSAREKVAGAIIDLAEQFRDRSSRRNTVTFILHLTRADLADWLGLTVETVSLAFSQFRREGLIAFDQPERVTILDAAGLLAAAGRSPAAHHTTTI